MDEANEPAPATEKQREKAVEARADLLGHDKPAHWFNANTNGFADEVHS
jgi:hypothetical protein